MTQKKRKFVGSFNRFRLILTLGLAVLLPAAALIYINFSQLRHFQRDKVLEAAIHRDFQETLAIAEKQLNKKAFALAEDAKERFPSADASVAEKEQKLDEILTNCSGFTHAFIFDGKDIVFRTRASQLEDPWVREEHDKAPESYKTWFKVEGKYFLETIRKKPRQFGFNTGAVKRKEGEAYMSTAIFPLPGASKDRVVIGGVCFDPYFLKNDLFPNTLDDFLAQKQAEESGNPVAMMLYAGDLEGGSELRPVVMSSRWGQGKPEVSRKLDNAFSGLSLGIKFQGTSVQELGEQWVHRSFVILGILSLMIIGGLVLTKHMVSKEIGLAKLKSDFVSNVSHELRTPLALIRLYAETLELGRITTPDKKEQYYQIIRKESERLTALINNILDFSRIEAGRKEYEFRETDIAELVRNTLDSYRYQVEQQGFALEENIASDLPRVFIDREAIARALVNLVNNALKYSRNDKFLGVKLYKDQSLVKLEVEDHGIGIASKDQGKIFEKFYRAGDPLVHNTKGSGLGLSLVRHITHAHGGNIEVQSTPGRGSRFILSLPLRPSMGTAPA
ncbi:MAG: sensor histidine kinase [Blastocatellia bacterium]|nr:MAG: sensor histidine kinase [Blastocatellia bacterium]